MTKKAKETWKKEAQARTKMLKEKIDALASKLIVSPEKLSALAKNWRGGFHSYSFYNLFGIWIQKPNATLCAGLKQWSNLHKRTVKTGEKALYVLAPRMISYMAVLPKLDADGNPELDKYGKKIAGEKVKRQYCQSFFSVAVFDVSQTEGEDLDIGMNSSRFVEEEFTVDNIIGLFPEYEWSMVQNISDGSTNGKEIRVSVRKNKAQEVVSSIHELAHVLLGHCKHNGYEKAQKLGREIQELEAEAVAYVVSECLGIENPDSATYIRGFNGDKDKMQESAGRMLSVVTKIMKRLTGEEKVEVKNVK